MSGIFDQEALADRARELEALGLNGIHLVFVDLDPPAAPTQAWLTVEFHSNNVLGDIVNAIQVLLRPPTDIFTLRGGTRIRAGEGAGQVQVLEVQSGGDRTLHLRVAPIGDYSTYTLTVRFNNAAGLPLMDPLFASIGFKFRPGCFNLNCAPTFGRGERAPELPAIDYLSRDFLSFKHTLIAAMRVRVPDWQPTSEADLDQVILDLLAADGDELSDFQDRVMSEAYLGTARKRVSLARHARLVDYHIHQGNQAGTWLALEVEADALLPAGFGVWTGENWSDAGAAIFVTQNSQECLEDLNHLDLYTWDGALTALDAGATEADLALPPSLNPALEADALVLQNELRRADIRHLVIEEKLNPETGTVNGRDLTKRQLLRLRDGTDAAEAMFDPSANAWFVRVRWQAQDQLRQRYCFITRCDTHPPTTGVSAFHGNLVVATHGRPHRTVFRVPGSTLAASDDTPFIRYDEAFYEPTPWGVLCELPNRPLAYLDTPPSGETPTRSTAVVQVNGFADTWEEQTDLIESEGDDEHYIVETDELGTSRLRFGNGVNGMALPEEAVVTCDYQVGRGSTGNVGADCLTGFDALGLGVTRIWNPFDVTNGRDPEPVAEIIRRAPEAYRSRQLRAVTLADYVNRAEQLPGVAHAWARYAWTGSWRTVVVSIDPAGTTDLDDTVRRQIESYLDAVRLMGEDLEIRPAQYAALDIKVRLCAHPDYWPEDLVAELEMEFSDGYTADGRLGFFHPDNWTFGQPLYASQIIGRALSVKGVGRVLSVSMSRWQGGAGPTTSTITISPEDLPENLVERIEVQPFEIIQVANDPDHMEKGRILFNVQGGRQ